MSECDGKVKYPTPKGASVALTQLLQRDERRGVERPTHVYRCPRCHAYHLGRMLTTKLSALHGSTEPRTPSQADAVVTDNDRPEEGREQP